MNLNRRGFKEFVERGAAAQRAVDQLTQCEVKSAQCNGRDVVRVQFRLPRCTDSYDATAKLCCHGCRLAHWGAFRYLRGPFQQELNTKVPA